LFSRSAVSITPIFPPVDLLPTFEEAPRRIYMSATIADDSEIVRTFGASREAIEKPVTSTSLAGVGERMILVPGLMKLGSTPVLPMVKDFAKKIAAGKRGVAVLSPSGTAAKKWTDIAEYPDTTKAVSEKIAAMQVGDTHGPVVLASRYDGIDLAGNACRFLVMDDLPQGTSNYDVFRMNVVADAAVNSLLAQRIEQGIGRGTARTIASSFLWGPSSSAGSAGRRISISSRQAPESSSEWARRSARRSRRRKSSARRSSNASNAIPIGSPITHPS
jgi:replicative superfamily II helicase